MRWGMLALIGFAVVGPLRAADGPRAIVEKAIKAHGGEENLNKYQAAQVKGKGSMSDMGMEATFTLELYAQSPNKVRSDLKFKVMGNTFEMSQVFDGKKAWSKAMGQVMEVEGDQLEDLKEEAYSNYLERIVPLIEDKNLKLEAAPEMKVEGKPALGVKVVSKGHKDTTMYFDKASGLLVMTKRKSKDSTGMEVDAESYLSNYKSFNGVKQATKVLVKHGDKKFIEAELIDIKLLEKLDDKTFAKPE